MKQAAKRARERFVTSAQSERQRKRTSVNRFPDRVASGPSAASALNAAVHCRRIEQSTGMYKEKKPS